MTGAPFPPILALFLPAAAVALAGTWASVFLARRLGAMDPPGGDLKIHPRPIPRLGGLGVGAGVLAGLLLYLFLAFPAGPVGGWRVWGGFIAGYLLILAVGFIDDLVGLPPLRKLAGQAAAALIPALFGWGAGTAAGWNRAGAIWTFGLILVMVNAANFIDGMDGLAGGCLLVSAGAIGAAGLFLGRMEVAALGAVTTGAAAGFLPFNLHPARVFLGDSGSLGLGFLLAGAAAGLGNPAEQPAAAAGVVLILFLPLYDLALGIVRRAAAHRPLFMGDRGHFYDRIHRAWGSYRGTVVLSWILAGILGAAGLAVLKPAAGRDDPLSGLILLWAVLAAAVLVAWKTGLTRFDDDRGQQDIKGEGEA